MMTSRMGEAVSAHRSANLDTGTWGAAIAAASSLVAPRTKSDDSAMSETVFHVKRGSEAPALTGPGCLHRIRFTMTADATTDGIRREVCVGIRW